MAIVNIFGIIGVINLSFIRVFSRTIASSTNKYKFTNSNTRDL